MNIFKGAYIYKDLIYDDINLFVYFKMSESDLHKALPGKYKKEKDKNYYICFFQENGCIFPDQSSYNEIRDIIRENDMKDLNIYCLKNYYFKLNEELYNKYIEIYQSITIQNDNFYL